MRNSSLRVLAVALLGGVLLSGCTSSGPPASAGFAFSSPGGQIEFTYPAAQRGSIGNLSGPRVLEPDSQISLSDYPDTVMVLNIWGSWCGPCRSEAADLNRAAEQTADLPAQFLGINVRDTRDAAADFHRSKQVPYPSIFDPSMRTLTSIRGYPTSSIPSTLVLDRQHRVAAIFLRTVTADELTAVIRALVTEPPDPPPPASAPTMGNGS